MAEQSFTKKSVRRDGATADAERTDLLAVEEPLEIRLGWTSDGQARQQAVSVTMRTPGDDFDLAIGFLLTEAIVKSPADVVRTVHCGTGGNTVRVDLRATAAVDLKRLERHFYTTSSCGVCGKTSLEALDAGARPLAPDDFPFSAETIHRLPEVLRESQSVFDRTGGLHAAALFDRRGDLEIVREDVGRHNAVDKVIGAKFQTDELPLARRLLFVSGRASFELVQKALMAGIPILAAVGAPSSLAVELAEKFEMSLIGFVRDNRFNIYSGAARIK